jgi:hypothetical protein
MVLHLMLALTSICFDLLVSWGGKDSYDAELVALRLLDRFASVTSFPSH